MVRSGITMRSKRDIDHPVNQRKSATLQMPKRIERKVAEMVGSGARAANGSLNLDWPAKFRSAGVDVQGAQLLGLSRHTAAGILNFRHRVEGAGPRINHSSSGDA